MVNLALDDRFTIQDRAVCAVIVDGYAWDRDGFEVNIERMLIGEPAKFEVEYDGGDRMTIKCEDLTAARSLADIFRHAADLLDKFEKIRRVNKMTIEGWTETVRDESPDGTPVSWKQNVFEITLDANTHIETIGDKIRLTEEVFDNDQN